MLLLCSLLSTKPEGSPPYYGRSDHGRTLRWRRFRSAGKWPRVVSSDVNVHQGAHTAPARMLVQTTRGGLAFVGYSDVAARLTSLRKPQYSAFRGHRRA